MKKFNLIFSLSLSLLVSLIIISGCGTSGSSIDTDSPDKAFDMAKKNFDKGEYLDAIEDFSFIKVKFPGSAVTEKAAFYLGESYYFRKEYILAAYEFETFQKNYPLSTLIPDMKYRLGMCYYQLSPKPALDQEYTRYAISELTSFTDQYPTNKNAADANKRLEELKNKLAYKDFSVAENYMKVDNYRAASIYYQNVYENYIETEWADDAMVGQAEAYIGGKRYDDARKVLERFYKLFPNSNLKSKADKLKSSIAGK